MEEAAEQQDGGRSGRRWEHLWLLLVAAVFFAAVAVKLFFDPQPARTPSSATACSSNLKMLEGVKWTWAMEHHMNSNAVPALADLIGEDKYIRAMPDCPRGGTYTLGAVKDLPRCSVAGHTF